MDERRDTKTRGDWEPVKDQLTVSKVEKENTYEKVVG
jgi:hypothetical protein